MTGMENNSDIVELASYAPLFCHTDNRRWNVNLICFKDDKIFGIPSYYVQKIFNDNLATKIIESSVITKSFTDEAKVFVSAGFDDNDELIIKIANFSSDSTKINIEGVDNLGIKNIYSISSDNGFSENNLENTEYIKTIEIDKNNTIMPPYSVWVIRLV